MFRQILTYCHLVTTDSQTSEEDSIPPPLPEKTHRDSNYGNVSISSESHLSAAIITRGLDGYQFDNRPLPATPNSDDFTTNNNNNCSHYEVLEIKNREVISATETKIGSGKKIPPNPPPKPSRNSKNPLSSP